MNSNNRRNRRHAAPPAPAHWRSQVVLLLFIAAAGGLLARAFYLQVLNQDFLNRQGQLRYVKSLTLPAIRGAIYDRNGEPLALSAPTHTIWAVPEKVLSAPEKLRALAQALDTSSKALRTHLEKNRNRQFLYLARQLPPSQADLIKALNIPGVFDQREFKRYYPAGEALAQLVGLVNIDGQGQMGIERGHNDFLSGQPGKRQVIRDRYGHVVEDLVGFDQPQAGQRLELTISRHMQYAVYRELKQTIEDNHAASGMAVVLDPKTGELLAVASYPSFNPNNRSKISPEGMRERPIIDNFEPGSAIKPLLIASALETGDFSTDTLIDTEGGLIQVGSLVIRDSHDYGKEDFTNIIRKSSNVGAATVGLKMGAAEIWRGYKNFGLGSTTETGFPGEADGILAPYYEWGRVKTATVSYGYGVAVTALQLVRAYGAIANGGILMPLKLIKGPGAHVQSPPERVISKQTAHDVRQMLAEVVTPQGTARRADIPGYSEGGKTGTARKFIDGSYSESVHQAVFIGMAPIDDPQLVTFVLIDQPSAGHYYAGRVAAPAFSKIMQKALRIWNVPPTRPDNVAKGGWEVTRG